MENIYITDPTTKKPIKVTDLKQSIQQADEFRNYDVNDEHKQYKKYWENIYQQLIKIK